MCAFEEFSHFLGFDWASEHHDVCVLDAQGRVLLQFRFADTAAGWRSFREKLPPGGVLAVAVETSSGTFVDRLMEAGLTVFPVQPVKSKQYRKRIAPSGASDDQRDAWALADALRLDGRHWKALRPEDPLILELRLLCRDQVVLIEERTAKVNQLRAALQEYYPAALEAFTDWTKPSAWDFVLTFPTPQALELAGRRTQQRFLHTHHLGQPQALARRLEVFSRAREFEGTAPTTAAKSRLGVALAKCLRTLEAQIRLYDERIQELYNQHPDREWFGTLPISQDGRTAPRLLAELGHDRARFDSAQALQCQGGTAPVTQRSGMFVSHKFRRACNKHLRYAIHWFADLSRGGCTWAEAYYQEKRRQGMPHAAALRCLGQRWFKIIWKMWQTRRPYDPQFHMENQLRHGSWILQLKNPRVQPAPALNVSQECG